MGAGRAGQAPVRPQRGVGADGSDVAAGDGHGLVAQRPPAEQPHQPPPGRVEAGDQPGDLGVGSAHRVGPGQAQPPQGLGRPLLQGVAHGHAVGHRHRLVQPDQSGHQRLGRLGPQQRFHHLGGGGLGHQQNQLGGVVLGEGPDGGAGHQPADLGRQVPSAHPDHVRHPRPPPVQQGHRLLGPGAGRGHHPHRPGRHPVGEPQAHPGQRRGAGPRPHHQPARRTGPGLQGDLVFERHVVAEQQHVEAPGQGLVGLQGGVFAGHRDDGDVGLGGGGQGLVQILGPGRPLGGDPGLGGWLEQDPPARLQGGGRGWLAVGPQGQHQVVDARAV